MAIKILIGGSPCTHWSIAQKNNRETEPEGMGWELFKNYLIAKEKFKPDFFLYENNKSAAQAIKDQIAEEFGVGVDPDVRFTYINSALVSAQNRQRFYVTNFGDIEQPEDRGILLKDILETGETDREKGRAVIGSIGRTTTTREYFKKQQGTMSFEPVGTTKDGKSFALTSYYSTGQNAPHTLEKHIGSMVAEPVNTTEDGKKARTLVAGYYKYGTATLLTNDGFKGGTTCVSEPVRVGCMPSPDGEIKNAQGMRVYSSEGKSVNLTAQGGGLGAKTGLYAIPVNTTVGGKSYALTSSYYKCGENPCSEFGEEKRRPRIAEPVTIGRAIPDIVEKYGYVPEMFNAYNRQEIIDKSPTLSTGSMVTLFGKPDVIWASPDCTTYSVAAISTHRRREVNGNLSPISEYAKFCDKVNTHLIKLITDLSPKYYFIENPVDGLRKMSFMQGLPRYTVTYCQYGERRQKPTDIWTNHPDPQFKPPCKRGMNCHDAAPRGSKTGTQALKNAVEKSKIPQMLCNHIVDICEGTSRSQWLDDLLRR